MKDTEKKIIRDKDDLLEYFHSSSGSQKLMGIEFERFNLDYETLLPISYYDEERGVKRFLETLLSGLKGRAVMEEDNILGIHSELGNISLEPGAQLEYSSHPFERIEQTVREFSRLEEVLEETNRSFNYYWPLVSVLPFGRAEEIPLIPKHRYEIMHRYFKKTGFYADYMMRATACIQFNFSYGSEEEFGRMCKAAYILAYLAPLITLNSPFWHGKASGYLSLRNVIWHRTDDLRTGYIPGVLENSPYTFSDFIDYVLDIPVILISRNGRLVPSYQKTFSELLKGDKPVYMEDFTTHLNLIFPSVRPSNRIEIRVHDLVPLKLIPALCAFYKGLLFSRAAMEALFERTIELSHEDLEAICTSGNRLGFDFSYLSFSVKKLLEDILAIAQKGIAEVCPEELGYLDPLKEVLASGKTPAQECLEELEKDFNNSIEDLIRSRKLR